MKLSDWAKKQGITYKTAWRHYSEGLIDGAYQLPTGTIIVPDPHKIPECSRGDQVFIYARVSSSENKKNLDSQADRLKSYAMAKGYKISGIVKEIGSGVNDKRAKLLKLIKDKNASIILVEHKERLTRFGFNYIETLLNCDGRKIEVVNMVDDDKEDIVQDFIAIISSFCARIYGNRRSKRKTEKLIAELDVER